MAFSALKYVDELVEAGVPEKQAKAQVLILQDFKDSEIATKGDLARTEAALRGEIKELELKMKSMEVRLILSIAAIMGFFTLLPKFFDW